MTHLVVLGLDNRDDAERVFDLLARSATVDRVVEALKPYNPTVIQTSLSREREEELVEALQA